MQIRYLILSVKLLKNMWIRHLLADYRNLRSFHDTLVFLWKTDMVYVMDNHNVIISFFSLYIHRNFRSVSFSLFG